MRHQLGTVMTLAPALVVAIGLTGTSSDVTVAKSPLGDRCLGIGARHGGG